jgi:hypothetical protein
MKQIVRDAVRISCLVLVTGCGDAGDANVVARLGWALNYSDWTKTSGSTASDLRDCSNQLASSKTPYRPVHHVHISVVDPNGQVPGISQDFPCAQGFGGATIALRGIVRQPYTLTLEGRTDDDAVLYRHIEEAFDVSSLVEKTFTLNTVTAELSFYVRADGSLSCSPGASRVRYEMFLIKDGQVQKDATVSGEHSACDGRDFAETRIAEIPVFPERGANNNFTSTEYSLNVAITDAQGTPLFCANGIRRSLRPGRGNSGEDALLNSSACGVSR